MAVQGQFKVIQSRWFCFGTNQKCLCDFLLVFNSNLGCILHRFWDTAAYWSKNRHNRPFEPTPVSQIALALGDPCEFFDESYLARSWNHGAIKWWRNHDDSSFCFDTIPAVTNRRTDTSLSQTRSTHSVACVKTDKIVCVNIAVQTIYTWKNFLLATVTVWTTNTTIDQINS